MSISTLLSGVVNTVKQAVAPDAPKPIAAPPPPPPPAPVVPQSHQTGFDAAPVGGRGTTGGVEGQVAARADRDTPMNFYNTTQHERLTNLPRLTQVDGDPKSQGDLRTCGIQSVMAVMYAKNPAGIPKTAEYLLTQKGDKLDAFAKEQGLDPKKARADLQAIASGKASPRQVAVMSQMLMSDMKDRVPTGFKALAGNSGQVGTAGVDADALKILTKDILTDSAGVKVPEMRLELRDLGNQQFHWTAQFEASTMQDIEDTPKNDMVVAFDPWPRDGGKATTGVAMSRNNADRLHPGKRESELWIKPDGTTQDTTLHD